jgi:threonine-phosphate decarboxylase
LSENKVIDISSGISPLGPSKKVRASIRKEIKNIKNYPDPELTKLRRLLISKSGLSGGGILFANSIKELIYLIPDVFKPKKVLVIGPALRIYEEAVSSAGAKISYLNSDEKSGFITDVELTKEKIKGVDLLFIANPNRITGRSIDRRILYESFSSAEEEKLHVVMDESLIEFTEDDRYYNDILSCNNFITIRTTANFYGLPGLELAFAVSSPSMIVKLKQKNLSCVNSLAIEAARTALKDNVYKKLTRKYINDEKKLLVNALKKIRGIKCYDSDSNLLLIKLDCPGEKIINTLASAGFMIRECRDIEGLNGSFLRFSVFKHEYNLKFIRILSSYL